MSRAKRFAIDTDPELTEVDRLARSVPYNTLLDRAARARQIERIADHQAGAPIASIEDRLERNKHTVERIGPGVRVKAHDRYNVGTTIRVDSEAATADVKFTSQDGRSAVRTMAWEELTVVDRDAVRRPLTTGTREWLDREIAARATARGQWLQTVTDHGSNPGAAGLYQRAADTALAMASAHLAADRPQWLIHLLGYRPASAEGASAWDSAVETLTDHRLHTGVPANVPGLGYRASNPQTFDRASAQLALARNWLHHHPEHAEPNWPATPDHEQLLARQRDVTAILASAPPDQRHIIDQLLGGQLSLTDTQQLLESAREVQDERSAWILKNWSHVVEAAEIENALRAPAALDVELEALVPSPEDAIDVDL